jgi:hypothetical protein
VSVDSSRASETVMGVSTTPIPGGALAAPMEAGKLSRANSKASEAIAGAAMEPGKLSRSGSKASEAAAGALVGAAAVEPGKLSRSGSKAAEAVAASGEGGKGELSSTVFSRTFSGPSATFVRQRLQSLTAAAPGGLQEQEVSLVIQEQQAQHGQHGERMAEDAAREGEQLLQPQSEVTQKLHP